MSEEKYCTSCGVKLNIKEPDEFEEYICANCYKRIEDIEFKQLEFMEQLEEEYFGILLKKCRRMKNNE